MKERLFKGKSKRTKIFTLISAFVITVVIGLNVLLTHFGIYNTIFFDMTPEGLYTLSDTMVQECDEMFSELSTEGEKGKKIKITFCTDPDYLISSTESRLTYFMALKLQHKYPDFVEVKAENVRLNPTAVSQFKTTSLSRINSDDIIVSYGDRYRIASLSYFWVNGTNEHDHYNGEYRIATMMKSVTSIARPVAYFLTGHGETYFDPANPESEMSQSMAEFARLLTGRGLEIKLLNFEEEGNKVPEDCALLIINDPKTDFTYDPDRLDEYYGYVSETEAIDRYLVSGQGSIAVAKDYERELPVLESFLREWGFEFSKSMLKDEESSLNDSVSGEKTGTNIVAVYDTSEESYGYALYGEYADLSSSPLTVFTNTGSVKCSFGETNLSGEPSSGNVLKQYAPFLSTSPAAQHYIDGRVASEAGVYDLAAICARSKLDSTSNVTTYSYVFCVNSKDFFGSELLGEDSFANYDIVSAVIENISRVDDYASMHLGALSLNSASGGGKYIIPTAMSETDQTIYSNKFVDNNPDNKHVVIKEAHGISTSAKVTFVTLISLVPLTFAVVGIVVSIKRRYL